MSTLHNLSVITNSCVKLPMNYLENHKYENAGIYPIKDVDYNDESGEEVFERNEYSNKSVRFALYSHRHNPLIDEYNDSQDDLFLENIRLLKEKHRKNMELSENRYRDKVNYSHYYIIIIIIVYIIYIYIYIYILYVVYNTPLYY